MQKQNKLVGIIFFTLLFLTITAIATFAQVASLNSASKNSIPENLPSVPQYMPKGFPLNSLSANKVGFTYWSYRNPNGNVFAHTAIDLIESIGFSVFSIELGAVVPPKPGQTYFGTRVVINGIDGPVLYAHLDRKKVKAGTTVMAGDIIGTVGNSGNSRGPHLHLQLGTEEEPNYNNLQPLKHWFYHFKVSEISQAGSIIEPLEANIAPYTFLSSASDGTFPKTVNITAVTASRFSGLYNYSVRAVLYINGQRVKDAGGNPMDQLASMDGSVTFPDITLPELPADRIYHISVVLFDTEEVQTDSNGNKLYFVSQKDAYAVADPIARADVDLYVPDVAIDSPADGAGYNQCDAPKIDVTGHVKNFPDATAALSVNNVEQTASLSANGGFTNSGISLKEGANTFFIIAEDTKNMVKVSSKKVTVNYTKPKNCKPNDPLPGTPGGGGSGGGDGIGGIPINPNPTGPMVTFNQVCGQYTFGIVGPSNPMRQEINGNNLDEWGAFGLGAHAPNEYYSFNPTYWTDLHYLHAVYNAGAWQYSYSGPAVPAPYTIPCDLMPPDTLVPNDIFIAL